MATIRTFILLLALTLLLVFIGDLVGGRSGATIAFVIAAAMNFFAYWFSDSIVLAMYRAREVSEEEAPRLHAIVEDVAERAGIPKPRVYIVPMSAPNAFATGRGPSKAAVAVTEGLLRLLSDDELAGVIAHEIAHVRNRDVLVQTMAATLAGAIMMLASWARWIAIFGGYGYGRDRRNGGGLLALLAIAILAPIAAMLIQLAISRTREFKADETGALTLGTGMGLARALAKLDSYAKHVPAEVQPSTAHMFIVNPLGGRDGMVSLFMTHPPIQARIERLEALEERIRMGLV